jgi:hypothetical protein
VNTFTAYILAQTTSGIRYLIMGHPNAHGLALAPAGPTEAVADGVLLHLRAVA